MLRSKGGFLFMASKKGITIPTMWMSVIDIVTRLFHYDWIVDEMKELEWSSRTIHILAVSPTVICIDIEKEGLHISQPALDPQKSKHVKMVSLTDSSFSEYNGITAPSSALSYDASNGTSPSTEASKDIASYFLLFELNVNGEYSQPSKIPEHPSPLMALRKAAFPKEELHGLITKQEL
ncbi:solute-binding protein family protein 3 [Tanacetum coccineum]